MNCDKAYLKTSGLICFATFTVISIAEILFGTYMLTNMYKINRSETFSQMYIAVPSFSMILFGVALLHLIVLGYCGFCKEIRYCINTYSTILIVLSVLQILIGIFAVITFTMGNTHLTDRIKKDFEFAFKHFEKDPTFLNTIQMQMHCCGKMLPTDWNKLPSSCCDNEANCHPNSTLLHEKGCTNLVTNYVLFWNTVIGVVSVVLGVVQMLLSSVGFYIGYESVNNYYRF